MQDSSVIIANKGENLSELWKLVLTGVVQNYQSKLVSPKFTFGLEFEITFTIGIVNLHLHWNSFAEQHNWTARLVIIIL